LTLPAYAQKGDPKRGADVFGAKNCASCHPGGDNALEHEKPLKGAAFLKKYPTDESIARRIREGSSNGRMPSFSPSLLSQQELRDVIAYVRSLTPAAKPPSAKPPAKGVMKCPEPSPVLKKSSTSLKRK